MRRARCGPARWRGRGGPSCLVRRWPAPGCGRPGQCRPRPGRWRGLGGRPSAGAEDVDGDVGARSPGGVHGHVHVGAARGAPPRRGCCGRGPSGSAPSRGPRRGRRHAPGPRGRRARSSAGRWTRPPCPACPGCCWRPSPSGSGRCSWPGRRAPTPPAGSGRRAGAWRSAGCRRRAWRRPTPRSARPCRRFRSGPGSRARPCASPGAPAPGAAGPGPRRAAPAGETAAMSNAASMHRRPPRRRSRA